MVRAAAVRVDDTAAEPHLKAHVEVPAAAEVAAEAGLRYVSDAMPGITRVRRGDTFAYRVPDGSPLREAVTLARVKALAIPPAWTDVWICPRSNGHLQATGRDVRGRKQYRYHARWREVRDQSKFGRMVAFGEALPRIRARVDHDLSRSGVPRDRVLATVVRLLELTGIRVGNEEYVRANGSFGLTTLRNEHTDVGGSKVSFKFRGKSGKQHAIDVRDRRLANIVRRCRDLPGQELFEYVDGDGTRQDVTSTDVNRYIQEAGGEEFTAKDFRTWRGTVIAAVALHEAEPATSATAAAREVRAAIEHVASVLGNTVTVCRKFYVHPAIVDAYIAGDMPWDETPSAPGLAPEECATLALLRAAAQQQHAAAEAA